MSEWRRYARPFAECRMSYREARKYAEALRKKRGDSYDQWSLIHAYMAVAVGVTWQAFVEQMRREGKL